MKRINQMADDDDSFQAAISLISLTAEAKCGAGHGSRLEINLNQLYERLDSLDRVDLFNVASAVYQLRSRKSYSYHRSHMTRAETRLCDQIHEKVFDQLWIRCHLLSCTAPSQCCMEDQDWVLTEEDGEMTAEMTAEPAAHPQSDEKKASVSPDA